MAEAANACVIDIETLGVSDDSIVLSIGVVIADVQQDLSFAELVNSGLYLKVDVSEQQLAGRITDESTVKWWMSQGDAAKRVLAKKKTDVPVEEVVPHMLTYFEKTGYNAEKNTWWSRGPLDCRVLSNFFLKTSSFYDETLRNPDNHPLKFWMWRDIRTALEILTDSAYGKDHALQSYPGMIPHNALHDAACDFIRLREAFKG